MTSTQIETTLLWLNTTPLGKDDVDWMRGGFDGLLEAYGTDDDGAVSVDVIQLVLSAYDALSATISTSAALLGIEPEELVGHVKTALRDAESEGVG